MFGEENFKPTLANFPTCLNKKQKFGYSFYTLLRKAKVSTFRAKSMPPTATKEKRTIRNGSVIRWAFILEAIATTGAGILVLSSPDVMLNYLVDKNVNENIVTPLVRDLTQWIGGLSLAFAIACLFAIPNTREALSLRVALYWILGSGEALMCTLFLFQLWVGHGLDSSEKGLSDDGLLLGVQQMAPMVAWRLFALVAKPHWFGEWVVSKEHSG